MFDTCHVQDREKGSEILMDHTISSKKAIYQDQNIDIEKIREGTAIFTTIANNSNKSREIPKQIEVTQEDINASPVISVHNVSE